MATPLYDALVATTRDWANKPEVATLPDSVIKTCLDYSADDIYKTLRIPPLEITQTYQIVQPDNNSPTDANVSIIPTPASLVEFIMIRTVNASVPDNNVVFNEVTDKRSFFDHNAEFYGRYRWMWKENYIYIYPQLQDKAEIEIHFYRQLPPLNSTYEVAAVNYIGTYADSAQPYLTIDASGTTIWKVTLPSGAVYPFNTEAEADAYILANGGTKSSQKFVGKEAGHWLRDFNKQMLIWGALKHLGAYIDDERMEARYDKKFNEVLNKLNAEERFRRARGGNVQVHVITNNMI